MRQDLERRLDDLDAWKDALLGSLAGESEERLAFRPEGRGWCALDVVQHLVLVEEGVVGYARKKLRGPAQNVPLLDRAKLALLVLVLKSPIRFRAPVPQVIPEVTFPLGEVSDRWGRARRELRELLGALPSERQESLLFRHPIGGALDPAGTLVFIEEHAKHHGAQIRRYWGAPGCPG
ncbi:MAG: DinB family protein [Deltaproteobacteria bacterium]|nr:DinB family protein [Deltaproteobacteria bacterium]